MISDVSSVAADLLTRIQAKTARVGIVGLGYVGLPLAHAFSRVDFPVTGFDVDVKKITALSQSKSYIQYIHDDVIAEMNASGRFLATTDFSALKDVSAVLMCVPTPLTKHREPDMSYVVKTSRAIMPHLKKGHLIILESTTYPGTTAEVVRPILEESGLKAGVDFFLSYSPEREDPGNPDYRIDTIPKVVGADDSHSRAVAEALYRAVATGVVPVSSAATAEAVKLTENIFRCVNIALVNELKIVFDAMGIDVWEVIEAAKSKPFGFMPFYPGPGLGGHCIPIDPFYLTWKAHEYGIPTRFIELAGHINTSMPSHIVTRLLESLDQYRGRGLKGARILLMGVAYKKNVDDMRESPAIEIMSLLQNRGAIVSYHDPFIPHLKPSRGHRDLPGQSSIPLDAQVISGFDAVLICTDHDGIDYDALVQHSALVVDTRNATKNVTCHREKIVKA